MSGCFPEQDVRTPIPAMPHQLTGQEKVPGTVFLAEPPRVVKFITCWSEPTRSTSGTSNRRMSAEGLGDRRSIHRAQPSRSKRGLLLMISRGPSVLHKPWPTRPAQSRARVARGVQESGLGSGSGRGTNEHESTRPGRMRRKPIGVEAISSASGPPS